MKESDYKINSTSMDAVIACIFAGISTCGIIGAIIISYYYDGKGPAVVGLLGIGSVITALMGVVFTVSAWKSEDGGLLMKKVAGIINAIPLLIGIILYILGWVL